MKIINKLEEYGYTCITTEKSENVSEPVSFHADMLYLKVSENRLLVSSCQKDNILYLKQLGYTVDTVELSPGYKTECKLNVIVAENTVILNPKTAVSTEELFKDKQIINVKQGYTKCSTVVIDDNNFITEDKGIYSSLISSDKNCLLIDKGHIKLEGYEYGFIGGASAYIPDSNTLLFFGDIKQHPDYNSINKFCSAVKINLDYMPEEKLTDIGGVILL